MQVVTDKFSLRGAALQGATVLCLTCACAVRVSSLGQSTHYRPVVRHKLQVPFRLTRGMLAICLDHTRAAGHPIEAFETLYLLDSPAHVQIHQLRQLRGRVQIKTCRQALAFVRLRTSPRTFGSFSDRDGSAIEVISRDTVGPELMFGDREMDGVVWGYPEGSWGIVEPSDRQLAPLLATCAPSGRGYEIHRTLLVDAWKRRHAKWYLMRVTEWVGPDGTYRIRQRARLPLPAGPGTMWVVPSRHLK